jgi:hypothetical protein
VPEAAPGQVLLYRSSTEWLLCRGSSTAWLLYRATARVLAFSQAVSLVAMPAMAGLLIVAGYQSIKWDESFQKETLKIYEKLSLEVAEGKPDLIIFDQQPVDEIDRAQTKNQGEDKSGAFSPFHVEPPTTWNVSTGPELSDYEHSSVTAEATEVMGRSACEHCVSEPDSNLVYPNPMYANIAKLFFITSYSARSHLSS